MRQRLVSVVCIAALVAPVAATVRQRWFGRRQGEGKMRAAFATLLTSLLLIPALAVAQNTPPVADAGPDTSVQVNIHTLLQGSATDADDDRIVGWAWAVESSPAGSTPVLDNPTSAQTGFVADVVGDYVISLVVSDGLDFSEPDFVTVTVFDILPPVAVATADVTSGPAPLTVHFDGSGSTVDPDVSGTLLYDWNFDDGTLSSEVSPTHTYGRAGKYLVSLAVLDARGQLDTAYIVITVGRFVVRGERVLVKADARKGRRKVIAVARDATTDLPAGPTGAGLPLVDDPVTNGGATLDVRVYAGDGGAPSTARYDLLGVDDGSTGYGWKRTGDGYVYRDGRGTQGPVRRLVVRRTVGGVFVLRAVMTGYAPNDPRTPTVPTVPPNPGTAAGLMLTFGVSTSGGSTYCLLWGNEAGGTIKRNDDALLKIVRPTAVAAACPLPGIGNGNTPPVADAGPDQSVLVGVSTTLAGSATDAENDAIVSWLWTVESSPSGSTPVLGTPTEPTTTFVADVVGTYVVSLVVSDGLDASAPDLVTIEVVAAGP